MFIAKCLLHFIEFLLSLLFRRFAGTARLALLWQENRYYRRYFREKNIHHPFEIHEKWFIHAAYSRDTNARKWFTLVKPETILGAWKRAVARYWTPSLQWKRKPGRPPITKAIRELIRDMKNDNMLWGVYRIQDELRKINVEVSRETIRKVLADYRKIGEIKPNLSWSKFLKAHWDSLFACDFFTVDVFGFSRLYVFFILELKSRRIVHWNVSTNPDIQFLRNQFSHFTETFQGVHLIHDNSGELKWFPYEDYGIAGIATVPYSPNMNAYAERFVRSVRTECLDWMIVFSQNQLRNIMREYVRYYNSSRPHQGIGKVPDGTQSDDTTGRILKEPVLFGLHHRYYRKAA
jgi:transposase InsO family protein